MAQTKLTTIQGASTILSTGLNSLVNADRNLSAAISNDGSGEHYPYAMFELNIAAQGTNRVAGAHCALYILPTIDGSTYPYGDDSLDPSPSLLVGSFALDDGALAARVVTIWGIPLPPTDFKVVLKNNTGQTLASSGNTLKIAQYTVESV
jgi:hypothetical protein